MDASQLYNFNKELVSVNKIRDLRLSSGMKQSDLAKLLSCAPTAVSKYELGQLDIGSETICRLCEIFGCSADYLLGRSVMPAPELSDEEARLLQIYTSLQKNAPADLVDDIWKIFDAADGEE